MRLCVGGRAHLLWPANPELWAAHKWCSLLAVLHQPPAATWPLSPPPPSGLPSLQLFRSRDSRTRHATICTRVPRREPVSLHPGFPSIVSTNTGRVLLCALIYSVTAACAASSTPHPLYSLKLGDRVVRFVSRQRSRVAAEPPSIGCANHPNAEPQLTASDDPAATTPVLNHL
jgi:hypothetical protein